MRKNHKSNYETPRITVYALKPGKALLQGSNYVLLDALGGRGDFFDGGDPFAEL